MKRIVLFVAGLCFWGVVQADSPHFVSCVISSDGAGNLTASFKEAGLGDNQFITHELAADARATYVCINGGSNHPQAANKETVEGPVSATGTFSSGKNGQVTAGLTASPPSEGDFSCPPGQHLELACVEYTNAAVTDVTNSVSGCSVSGPIRFTDPRYGQFCEL